MAAKDSGKEKSLSTRSIPTFIAAASVLPQRIKKLARMQIHGIIQVFIRNLLRLACLKQCNQFTAMELEEAPERDWASLPPEVLNLIAKSLTETPDFLRFRAVCTTWRSSTPVTDSPPQFPWILVDSESCNEPALMFYSIRTNKLFTVQSAKLVNKYLFGQTDGYFPAMHEDRLSLLNPLNNQEVPLPGYRYICFKNECPSWIMHRKNRAGQSVVLCGIWHVDYGFRVYFCFADGQDCWHALKPYSHYAYCDCDCFYLNDMFFVVERGSHDTKVIDINTGALAYVVPRIEGDATSGNVYLVEASEDILRVFLHSDLSDVFSFNGLFDVHRLDVSENTSPCWVKVDNIGKYAFFIDSNGGFVLDANDSSGIKANFIYLLEEVHSDPRKMYQLKSIDIETGATETSSPLPCERLASWYVPNLHRL